MLISLKGKRGYHIASLHKLLRVMKLTCILLIATALHVSATGYAQSITLSVKDAPLTKVFESIKEQSGYRFFYNEEQLQKSRPVTVDVRGASLEATLDLCLKDQPFSYTIVNKVIVIKEKTNDPGIQLPSEPDLSPIDVKGRVVDEKGQPVAGASVQVKTTKQGTTTDDNGYFELKGIDENATLLISGVNIETFEIKVSGKTDLATLGAKTRVTIGENVTVVNTGYQQIPKERATGSFTQIDNKTYNQQVGTDVLKRLEFITNGLTMLPQRVAFKKDIVIRGQSTIRGPRGPLIIIDNFPYEGDINNINPNDVENITILKDAAAASIWGTRAGNGVIVITTKKGRFNQPMKVDFAVNFSFYEKPDLFYIKEMSTSDFIDVEQFLFGKGFYDPYEQNTAERLPLSPVVEILIQKRDGLIAGAQADAMINALRGLDVRNDFSKYYYRKEINQQYWVQMRGGSNSMGWSLSTGYDKALSNLKAEYDRINFKSDLVFKIAKGLELTTGLYYTQSRSLAGWAPYRENWTFWGLIPPYTQFADGNGNALPVFNYYRMPYLDTAGAGKLLDWKFYPLSEYEHIKNKTSIQDVKANIGVDYKIINGLKAQLRIQYQRQQITNRNLRDAESYFARDLVNSFSQINWTTGQVAYAVPKGGVLDLSNNLLETYNVRGQVDYNKAWLRHEIAAIAGTEIRQTKNTGNIYRTYGYNDDILVSNPVDFTKMYPRYMPVFNDFIPNLNDFSKTTYRFVSFFANAAYTYDKKYTLSASLRRDASNLFGLKTNDKWTPLWSAGASWLISNENFYKSTFFPYLNLRATFGFQGNVSPELSAATTIGYSGVSPYTLLPYSRISNFYNPELRWEKVSMLNLGLDFRTKNNRISGSIEYYHKEMDDLYSGTLVDPTVGLQSTSIVKNIGNIEGNGFDIELNSLNINGRVKWRSDLIINRYTDKVTEIYQSSPNGSSYVGTNQSRLQGFPLYSLMAYKWGGLDPATGDPQGYIDGALSKNYNAISGSGTKISDLVYIGSNIPTVLGSLGNTLTWKNLSLTATISYRFGYYFRRRSIDYGALFTNSRGHSDYAMRWQKPGDEVHTIVPSMVYPYIPSRDGFYSSSEALATKADHIRFQFINLNYTIRKAEFKKLLADNINIAIIVNDIGIIWRANKYGVDPDYSESAPPPSRNISLSVRAGF